VLGGTPTTAGLFDFTVQVIDNLAVTFPVPALLHARIYPPPSFQTTSPLPSGAVGVAYSFQVLGSGGAPPTVDSIIGSLPPGLVFGAATAVLSGAPTTAGSYTFTLLATDGVGATASRAFTIAINPSPTITSTSP